MPPHGNKENHQDHQEHSACFKWVVGGTALAAGAVIVAPYVLPLFGASAPDLAAETFNALHSSAGAGSGLAGIINSGLSAVPLVGETLAKGGIIAAAASAATGIGGVLLGRYLDKHEDGSRSIKWGKVVTVAALTTSALIALPTALTGLSAGIAYLAALHSVELGTAAVSFLAKTIGAATSENLASAGLSTAAIASSHLLTCGAAAVPPLLSYRMRSHSAERTAVATLPPQASAMPSTRHQPTEQPLPPHNDPIVASVRLDKPTTAGEMVNGHLMFTRADTGAMLTKEELKVVNEAPIHFFINNSSLTDYHHIHPLPSQTPGEFDFSFKAGTSQPYKGWATITTLPDNKHHEVSVEMPPAIRRYIAPHVRMNSQVDTDGLSFDWKSDRPLQKGVTANVEVTIKDRNGNPVMDLQPVWGEWCHLEGFGTDFKTMMHTHAHGQGPTGKDDRKAAPLHFKITPPVDGPMQFYVQVRQNDKDIYAPIGQYVKAPELATQRVQKSELLKPTNFAPQLSMGIG